MLDDSAVRLRVYDDIVNSGAAPSVSDLAAELAASAEEVRASLRRLHDAHMLVLQPGGEILMANPFSAVPTPFITEVGERRWFGNCIWDGLGILATLHADGRVLTSCACCGEALSVTVQANIVAGEGVAHFALPARRWWDDIVFN